MSLVALAVALAIAPSAGFSATETRTVSSNGKPMFVFSIDRYAEAKPGDNLPAWALTDAQVKGVLDAAELWAGLFAPGSSNTQAIPFNVEAENDEEMADNASAHSEDWTTKDSSGREIDITYLMAGIVRNQMPESAKDKAGTYKINQTSAGVEKGVDLGTDVMPFIYPIMTEDENLGADITNELFTTTFHELSHALGIESESGNIGALLTKIKESRENTKAPPSEEDERGFKQLEDIIIGSGLVSRANLYTDALSVNDLSVKTADTPFSDHLVSYWTRLPGSDKYVLDYSNPTRFADRRFIARLDDEHEIEPPGGALDSSKVFVAGNRQADGVYFVGSNVSEVLAGSSLPGIPVNGWEGTGEDASSDLSHFELAHSMMSHQKWRNYVMLMEAELAAFQDMGYTIDRRNWFGGSEYGNDKTYVNTRPFYARNAEGTAYVTGMPNTATLATGFHVYGSRNQITQAADLLADGAGAVGIRVDGFENTVRLDKGSRITANGSHGTGILVAYGRGQSIAVSGSVEASGTGGRAISFDFGSNMLGDVKETRGSYIHKVGDANSPLQGVHEGHEVALNGPMGTLDISGSVKGSEAAIYIGKRALVSRINILSGASLQGDLISAWNPSSGELHPDAPDNYDDLSTTITFGLKAGADGRATGEADPDFAMAYSGSILSRIRESSQSSTQGSDSEESGGQGLNKLAVSSPALTSDPGTGSGSGSGSSGGTSNPLNVIVAGGTLALSGNVDVQSLTINPDANLALANAAAGNTIQTEDLTNDGTILVQLDEQDNLSGTIIATGTQDVDGGTIGIALDVDAYHQSGSSRTLDLEKINPVKHADGSADKLDSDQIELKGIASLTLQAAYSDGKILYFRDADAYSRQADDASAREAGLALDAAARADAVQSSSPSSSLSGDARDLIGSIDVLTTRDAISAALKKLSPEPYGYADAASIRMHRAVSRDLHRHLRESRETEEGPISALQTRDWTGFVTPYGERFIGGAQGKASATRSTSGGILGGLEKTDASGLTIGFHGGIGGRHQSVSTWHDARIDSAGAFAGVHAQFEPAGWDNLYLMGSARVGIEENRSKRTVTFGSYRQKAKGRYTSWTGEAMVGLGKDWKAGGVTFGPFASLEYIRTERESFREKEGRGASLSVAKGSNDALGAMLGAHVNVAHRTAAGLIVRAGLSGAYRRELLSTDFTAGASFREMTGGGSFTSHSRALGRNSVLVDAAVGITNRADTLRAELTAGYEGANTGNAVRFGIRGQYQF